MLDEDIKKLLNDLKMDNLVDELEQAKPIEEVELPPPVQHIEAEASPKKAPFSYRPLAIGALLLAIAVGPSAYFLGRTPTTPVPQQPATQAAEAMIAYNDDQDDGDYDDESNDPFFERKEYAASWATQIAQIDRNVGKNVHLLWDMLKRRKADLEDVVEELSDLLYDNAVIRQDFYGQNANVLLSRYQALDARHSVEIANQINAVYAQVKQRDNQDLSQAYAEMLGELGADSFTTYQVQIAKQLVEQEKNFEQAIQALTKSNNLPELVANLRVVEKVLTAIQTNGLMQTFAQVEQFQKMLAPSCKEALDRVVFKSQGIAPYSPDARALLEDILANIGASNEEAQKYLQHFDAQAEQAHKSQTLQTSDKFVKATLFYP